MHITFRTHKSHASRILLLESEPYIYASIHVFLCHAFIIHIRPPTIPSRPKQTRKPPTQSQNAVRYAQTFAKLTHSLTSIGDGVSYPILHMDEDVESLLGGGRSAGAGGGAARNAETDDGDTTDVN